MIEKEAKAPEERPLVAAVIYNRLHDRMPLGIDATLRYGLHIPPTESITQSQLAERHAVQHALLARACRRRRSRTRVSPRCRRPRTRRRSTTSTSRASPTTCITSSRRASRRSTSSWRRTATGDTRHVALLGHPVSHSLSPLMQNAAFAAAGLDWHYSAFDVEDAVDGGRGAADARLRRRERHDPAQAGGRRRVRRGRRRGGEHARLPRRPRARLQHRPRDPRRDRRDAGPA